MVTSEAREMNNESLGLVMVVIFSITTMFSWVLHMAVKEANKRRGDKKEDGGAGGLYISIFALIVSIGMYLSAKSDNDAIRDRFKKGEDIYCYESLANAHWQMVNRKDGWYLDDDILKHRERGLKIGIHRCKESF